jgi:hypothetical protein
MSSNPPRAPSVSLALAVLSERVRELGAEDRADLVEMARIFFGDAEAEERDAAELAIVEILEPPAGRLLSAEEWAAAAPPPERRV